MATDDLIDDGTVTEVKEAPAPSVSAADIGKAVKDSLAEFDGNVKALPSQIGQYVQQAITQAQEATARGNATQNQADLTQRLLSEPKSAITEIVQELLQNQLGPYLATQVQDNYEGLVDLHRAQVDSEYGDGTFDEVILADLEAVVDKTPNKGSKGSKKYIATVVDSIIGNKAIRPKLREKLVAKIEADKKAQAEMDAPTGVLDGGRRRGAKPTLSVEDTNFLARYEDATDQKVDRKLMEEAIAVRNRDGGWNIDNFPGLKR